MKSMRFKAGDRVKIKSNDFFNKNKGNLSFYVDSMALCFSNEIVTIKSHGRYPNTYRILEDEGYFLWTHEMIEGLVEEETKIGTALNPIGPKSNANCITRERVDALSTKIDEELPSGNPYEWECPEGYQFVDENGNVINATKIVLEKKKKEYPKTYEECCKVMNYCCNPVATKTIHKEELIRRFQFLLLYRDAYWKIAGEEMGLGKPWSPSDNNKKPIHAITRYDGYIIKDESGGNDEVLEFPTEEMRDAFYENFKVEIEFCKELL